MKKIFAVSLLVLSACAPASETTTSVSAAIETTVPPATTSTTTSRTPTLVIDDCSTPSVTFSALCEVYELVQQWHVDRPIPSVELASLALQSLTDHVPIGTEPPQRTLFCAVPHEDFSEFCEQLAIRVGESHIAVERAVEEAVITMTDLGLDPFTYYVPPEQAGAFRQDGLVGGVGILLDATDQVGSKCARIGESCPLEIVFVLEDNPGEDAGLMAGDRIVAVDGTAVEGKGFGVTAAAIAGDETGVVSIEIERNGEPIDIEIERSPLNVPTVEYGSPVPGVGYIRIPDFEEDIAGLVDDALRVIARASPETIVVDLRDNPGGLVSSVVDVASEFMDGGVVMEATAPDEQLEYPATEGGLATEQHLIVLVNKGTASAAEILAGALQDERSAMLLGTNTFGKDAVQIPFDLRNGGQLYVAVARWTTPLGQTAGNGGLSPDREVEFQAGISLEELVTTAIAAAS